MGECGPTIEMPSEYRKKVAEKAKVKTPDLRESDSANLPAKYGEKKKSEPSTSAQGLHVEKSEMSSAKWAKDKLKSGLKKAVIVAGISGVVTGLVKGKEAYDESEQSAIISAEADKKEGIINKSRIFELSEQLRDLKKELNSKGGEVKSIELNLGKIKIVGNHAEWTISLTINKAHGSPEILVTDLKSNKNVMDPTIRPIDYEMYSRDKIKQACLGLISKAGGIHHAL